MNYHEIVCHIAATFFQDGYCPISEDEAVKILAKHYEASERTALELFKESQSYARSNEMLKRGTDVIHRIEKFKKMKTVSEVIAEEHNRTRGIENKQKEK